MDTNEVSNEVSNESVLNVVEKAKETVNAGNFDAYLRRTFESVKTLRDRVQALICFAAAQYMGDGTLEKSGQTIFYSKILRAACETHGLNARGIQRYVEAVSNVEWKKDKVGVHAFCKRAEDKGKAAVVNQDVLAKPWYVWVAENVASNNAREFNLSKYLNQVLSRLEKEKISTSVFITQLQKREAALALDDAAA